MSSRRSRPEPKWYELVVAVRLCAKFLRFSFHHFTDGHASHPNCVNFRLRRAFDNNRRLGFNCAIAKLAVGSVASMNYGCDHFSDLLEVHDRSLTRIRQQLAIYFCLHRGKFDVKRCKLARRTVPHARSAPSRRAGPPAVSLTHPEGSNASLRKF